MINVLIPIQSEFLLYKKKLKRMYKNSQKKICDSNTFEFIINNTYFYAFTSDGTLIGAVYFFQEDDGKLFMNGFAGRNHHELNLNCVKMSLKWFCCDIYAEAQNRASALCLLRCGFKRFKDNVFLYKPIE